MTTYAPRAPDNPVGETITDTNGEQFYIYGKNRIKIKEHFSKNGKPIDELITGLVQSKIKEKVAEIA